MQVSWNSRHKDELVSLRKEEIEARQREAVLAAQCARLETQVGRCLDGGELGRGGTDALPCPCRGGDRCRR